MKPLLIAVTQKLSRSNRVGFRSPVRHFSVLEFS